MSRAPGLGRGLSALIGDQAARPSPVDSAPPSRGVREIEIALIRPNPNQPRKRFAEDAIAELAESISQRGVLQPILLRPSGDGYEIVAGERRWRAAQRARLHSIPAIVREIEDSTTAELALIENVQREDLNALEEAEGYRQLIEHYGHGQDEVARLVHKSRSHVANLLRLLELPESVRRALAQGEISMGHARAVASAADPAALVREVIAKGLSVRQTEALAKQARPSAAEPQASPLTAAAAPAVDADIAALERQLGDVLGLKVKIAHKRGSGAVTLNYSNLDQLDMLCQRLSGEAI
jgi:ParB family transcriptional regulator, chromosome partitioning protein